MSMKIMVLNDTFNFLYIHMIQCKYNEGNFPFSPLKIRERETKHNLNIHTKPMSA